MQHAAWHATPRRQRRTARSIGSLRRTRLSDPRRSPAVQRLPGGAQLPDGRRFAAQHAAYVRRREGAGRRTHGPRLCHAAPFAAAALRCAAADRANCTGVAPRQGDRLQMQQALSVKCRASYGRARCALCSQGDRVQMHKACGGACAANIACRGFTYEPSTGSVRSRRVRPAVKRRATESQRATRAGPFALSCAGAARRGPVLQRARTRNYAGHCYLKTKWGPVKGTACSRDSCWSARPAGRKEGGLAVARRNTRSTSPSTPTDRLTREHPNSADYPVAADRQAKRDRAKRDRAKRDRAKRDPPDEPCGLPSRRRRPAGTTASSTTPSCCSSRWRRRTPRSASRPSTCWHVPPSTKPAPRACY